MCFLCITQTEQSNWPTPMARKCTNLEIWQKMEIFGKRLCKIHFSSSLVPGNMQYQGCMTYKDFDFYYSNTIRYDYKLPYAVTCPTG